jgi:hypothetical protein
MTTGGRASDPSAQSPATQTAAPVTIKKPPGRPTPKKSENFDIIFEETVLFTANSAIAE